MIPTKTIVDKSNQLITNGGLTENQFAQLSGVDISLESTTPRLVAHRALLPDPLKFKGIAFYVNSEQKYYFSDGTQWRSDFTSDPEIITTTLYMWGSAANGRLGDNTSTSKSSPVTVVGGITNWAQISAGGAHTLGLTLSGVLYSWGQNLRGELGDGTTTSRSSPVTVVGGITNWKQASPATTGTHNVAITSSGIAYAWGYNTSGQLGDSTTSSRLSPVTVTGGITDWIQVACGTDHSIGLTNSGFLYAWGNNGSGRLGDNTTNNRNSPVLVVGGITSWNQIDGGIAYTLGLTSSGIVYAWGYNTQGQLGDGTATSKSSPVSIVGGITNWVQVSAGGNHSLGLTASGVIYSWGQNTSGELGDNTTSNRSSPVTVTGGITNWAQVSAGTGTSIGLTNAGLVYTWGQNTSGQIGDNTTIAKSNPVLISGGITNWRQVSMGASFAGALSVSAQATKGFIA